MSPIEEKWVIGVPQQSVEDEYGQDKGIKSVTVMRSYEEVQSIGIPYLSNINDRPCAVNKRRKTINFTEVRKSSREHIQNCVYERTVSKP